LVSLVPGIDEDRGAPDVDGGRRLDIGSRVGHEIHNAGVFSVRNAEATIRTLERSIDSAAP
jgi:hypothetical protein